MLKLTADLLAEFFAGVLAFLDVIVVSYCVGLHNCVVIGICRLFANITETATAVALSNCFRNCRPLLNETEEACVLTLLFTMYWAIQLLFAAVSTLCMRPYLGLFADDPTLFSTFFFIETFFGPFGRSLLIITGTFADARNQGLRHVATIASASVIEFTFDMLLSLMHHANKLEIGVLIVWFGCAQHLSYLVFNIYHIIEIFRAVPTSSVRYRFSYLRVFSASDVWNTIRDFLRYFSTQLCDFAFQIMFMYQNCLVYRQGSNVLLTAHFMFYCHLLIFELANVRNRLSSSENTAKLLILWESLNYEEMLHEFVEEIQNTIIMQFLFTAFMCPIGYLILQFFWDVLPEAVQIHSAATETEFSITAVFCASLSAFNGVYYHSLQFFELFEMYLPVFIILVLNVSLAILQFTVPLYMAEPPNAIMEFALMEVFKTIEGYSLVWLIKKLFIRAVVQLRLRLEDDAYRNIQPLSQAQTVSYLETQSNFSKNLNAPSGAFSDSGTTTDQVQ